MVHTPSHGKSAQHYNFGCMPINSKTFVAENYSPAIFHEKILEAMKKYWLAGVAVVSTCYSVDKNKL